MNEWNERKKISVSSFPVWLIIFKFCVLFLLLLCICFFRIIFLLLFRIIKINFSLSLFLFFSSTVMRTTSFTFTTRRSLPGGVPGIGHRNARVACILAENLLRRNGKSTCQGWYRDEQTWIADTRVLWLGEFMLIFAFTIIIIDYYYSILIDLFDWRLRDESFNGIKWFFLIWSWADLVARSQGPAIRPMFYIRESWWVLEHNTQQNEAVAKLHKPI